MTPSLSILANLRVAGALALDNDAGQFPANPKVGTLVIKQQALYAYLAIGGVVTWYPLVRLPESYIHNQRVPMTEWVIDHGLGTDDIWYLLQDHNGQLASPMDVEFTDLNTLKLRFSEEASGRVLVVGSASNMEKAIDQRLSEMVTKTLVGAPNGVAALGADGKVPLSQLHPIADLDKSEIGLDQVDNTSDLDKPVSIAQQAAFDLKADQTALNTAVSNLVTSLATKVDKTAFDQSVEAINTEIDTKADQSALTSAVNTINTEVATKATTAALTSGLATKVDKTSVGVTNGVAALGADGKVPAAQLPPIPEVPVKSVNTKTGDVALTKADVGLGNVDNTSDANKPVSTATQTALNAKLDASKVGAVNGVASLDATGKVPTAQLPPTGVSQVNGKTGNVTLSAADVGAVLLNGDSKITGNVTMAGSIIPDADITYDLGSPTKAWRDVYIGPHSIYMNGKKILEDVSDTITFSTDADQNLRIQTTGAGNLELQAAAQVQIKGSLSILAGKKVLSSDGNAIQFGAGIDLNNNRISNVGAPVNPNDVATKGYVETVTTADATLVRTSGDQTIAGAKTFSNDVVINGNLTIKGTSQTTIGETILIQDNIIELNSNVTTGSPTEDGGFQVRRGDAGIVKFVWDEANDRFTMKDGAVTPNYLNLYTTGTITAGTFVGALTGNAATASKLATARLINGVQFDGSSDISFSTSNVAEGSNQYFTLARARAAVTASGTGLGYDANTGVVSSNATSANTASTLVARDANGDFAAGTITAALAGNASTAAKLQTARTINGVSFDGSANISFDTDKVGEGATNKYFTNARVRAAVGVSGTGLGYDAATGTISSNATSANTGLTVVARDASGNFSAGTITATLSGNATTASSAAKLTTARTINGVSFDGTANISFGTDAVAEGATNKYYTAERVAADAPVKSVNGRTGALSLTAADVGALAATAKAADANLLDGLNSTQFVRSDSTVASDPFGLVTISKSLTLNTNWQDTGITGPDLADGSFMVQVFANDQAVGGGHYNTYYSGVMSWFSTTTNEVSSDEIALHRAGHASNAGQIFLRVMRTATPGVMKLQIAGASNNSGASSYQFKFRRMI